MYSFYVLEMQTNEGGGSVLSFGYNDEKDAMDKFLDTWKVAMRSDVLVHTVMIVTNRGTNVRPPVTYTHPVEG